MPTYNTFSDFFRLADKWEDVNYDGKVDFLDFKAFIDGWPTDKPLGAILPGVENENDITGMLKFWNDNIASQPHHNVEPWDMNDYNTFQAGGGGSTGSGLGGGNSSAWDTDDRNQDYAKRPTDLSEELTDYNPGRAALTDGFWIDRREQYVQWLESDYAKSKDGWIDIFVDDNNNIRFGDREKAQTGRDFQDQSIHSWYIPRFRVSHTPGWLEYNHETKSLRLFGGSPTENEVEEIQSVSGHDKVEGPSRTRRIMGNDGIISSSDFYQTVGKQTQTLPLGVLGVPETGPGGVGPSFGHLIDGINLNMTTLGLPTVTATDIVDEIEFDLGGGEDDDIKPGGSGIESISDDLDAADIARDIFDKITDLIPNLQAGDFTIGSSVPGELSDKIASLVRGNVITASDLDGILGEGIGTNLYNKIIDGIDPIAALDIMSNEEAGRIGGDLFTRIKGNIGPITASDIELGPDYGAGGAEIDFGASLTQKVVDTLEELSPEQALSIFPDITFKELVDGSVIPQITTENLQTLFPDFGFDDFGMLDVTPEEFKTLLPQASDVKGLVLDLIPEASDLFTDDFANDISDEIYSFIPDITASDVDFIGSATHEEGRGIISTTFADDMKSKVISALKPLSSSDFTFDDTFFNDVSLKIAGGISLEGAIDEILGDLPVQLKGNVIDTLNTINAGDITFAGTSIGQASDHTSFGDDIKNQVIAEIGDISATDINLSDSFGVDLLDIMAKENISAELAVSKLMPGLGQEIKKQISDVFEGYTVTLDPVKGVTLGPGMAGGAEVGFGEVLTDRVTRQIAPITADNITFSDNFGTELTTLVAGGMDLEGAILSLVPDLAEGTKDALLLALEKVPISVADAWGTMFVSEAPGTRVGTQTGLQGFARAISTSLRDSINLTPDDLLGEDTLNLLLSRVKTALDGVGFTADQTTAITNAVSTAADKGLAGLSDKLNDLGINEGLNASIVALTNNLINPGSEFNKTLSGFEKEVSGIVDTATLTIGNYASDLKKRDDKLFGENGLMGQFENIAVSLASAFSEEEGSEGVFTKLSNNFTRLLTQSTGVKDALVKVGHALLSTTGDFLGGVQDFEGENAALKENVIDFSKELGVLDTSISSLDTSIGNLGTSTNLLDTSIDNLGTGIGELGASTDVLNTSIGNLSSQVGGLDSVSGELGVISDNVGIGVDQLVDIGQTLDVSVNELKSFMDLLTDPESGLNEFMSNYNEGWFGPDGDFWSPLREGGEFFDDGQQAINIDIGTTSPPVDGFGPADLQAGLGSYFSLNPLPENFGPEDLDLGLRGFFFDNPLFNPGDDWVKGGVQDYFSSNPFPWEEDANFWDATLSPLMDEAFGRWGDPTIPILNPEGGFSEQFSSALTPFMTDLFGDYFGPKFDPLADVLPNQPEVDPDYKDIGELLDSFLSDLFANNFIQPAANPYGNVAGKDNDPSSGEVLFSPPEANVPEVYDFNDALRMPLLDYFLDPNYFNQVNPYDARMLDIVAGPLARLEDAYKTSSENITHKAANQGLMGGAGYRQSQVDLEDKHNLAQGDVWSDWGQLAASTDWDMKNQLLKDYGSFLGNERNWVTSQQDRNADVQRELNQNYWANLNALKDGWFGPQQEQDRGLGIASNASAGASTGINSLSQASSALGSTADTASKNADTTAGMFSALGETGSSWAKDWLKKKSDENKTNNSYSGFTGGA